MDIKSTNFAAEANKCALNPEKSKAGLISPLGDKALETGLAPLGAITEPLGQKDFLLIEIQEKSKVEEYKKVNLLLNQEANFVKFLKEFSEGHKIFFAFEKPKNFLLGFLNTEFASLGEATLILLFKQSIEIILKLKEIAAEKFDFFNAHLFSVAMPPPSQEFFSNNYPILKILYHGKNQANKLLF